MYVLHHADQPELYNGLPKDPHISPMVRFWKGFAKPLALAAMALTALVGFFHFIARRTQRDRRWRMEAAAQPTMCAVQTERRRSTMSDTSVGHSTGETGHGRRIG